MSRGPMQAGLMWRLRRQNDAGARQSGLVERLRGELDPVASLLLEGMDAGLLVVDRQGRVVRGNERLRGMLDPQLDLAAGTCASDIAEPAGRDELWDRLRKRLNGQPGARLLEVSLRGASGPMAAELAVTVLREEGAVAGLLLRVTDVSDRRGLQAQLAQSQKLQAVGQLAAGIAHDFNNLLTAILGAAESIEQRGGTTAETVLDAAEIRSAAERGAGLVRQLLAFGRQQALEPRPIAVNEAIGGLSGLLTRLLGSRIALALELEEPGCLARVDPTQFDQVLINLAVNARDAMPDGGRLTIRSGHIALFRPLTGGVETVPPGRYVMIEVADTGVGIDPGLLPRIFDPFVTTRRDRGGSGLGLSTVHGIIRQSDGFLAVESEPGSFTRLRVYLPRLDPEPVHIPPRPVAPPDGGPMRGKAADDKGLRGAVAAQIAAPRTAPPRTAAPQTAAIQTAAIQTAAIQTAAIQTATRMTPTQMAPPVAGAVVLLVDDEPVVRRMAERALEAAGLVVASADCADSALALADAMSSAPMLLISDVVMPGMDGPDLAAALRARWPELRVLLVSGYAEDMSRRVLRDAHSRFLTKPYRLSELVTTARALLYG